MKYCYHLFLHIFWKLWLFFKIISAQLLQKCNSLLSQKKQFLCVTIYRKVNFVCLFVFVPGICDIQEVSKQRVALRVFLYSVKDFSVFMIAVLLWCSSCLVADVQSQGCIISSTKPYKVGIIYLVISALAFKLIKKTLPILQVLAKIFHVISSTLACSISLLSTEVFLFLQPNTNTYMLV